MRRSSASPKQSLRSEARARTFSRRSKRMKVESTRSWASTMRTICSRKPRASSSEVSRDRFHCSSASCRSDIRGRLASSISSKMPESSVRSRDRKHAKCWSGRNAARQSAFCKPRRRTMTTGDHFPLIGILGGGQLGRMLALAAIRMGLRVRTLAPKNDGPADGLGDAIFSDWTDREQPDRLRIRMRCGYRRKRVGTGRSSSTRIRTHGSIRPLIRCVSSETKASRRRSCSAPAFQCQDFRPMRDDRPGSRGRSRVRASRR
jgi:hypothetical protein